MFSLQDIFFSFAVSAGVLLFIVSILKEKSASQPIQPKKRKKKNRKKGKEKKKEECALPKVENDAHKPDIKEESPKTKPKEKTDVKRQGAIAPIHSEKNASKSRLKGKTSFAATLQQEEITSSFAAAVQPANDADFIHVDGEKAKQQAQEDVDFWALPKDKGLGHMDTAKGQHDTQPSDSFMDDGWEVVRKAPKGSGTKSMGHKASSSSRGLSVSGGDKKIADESTKKQRESSRKKERERQKKEMMRVGAQENGLHQVWS